MIIGRVHIYKGFLGVEHPDGTLRAYRNPTYYRSGIYSYEVTGPIASIGGDLHKLIDDAEDYGEFTIEVVQSLHKE